jgi:hypothetical protein
MTVRSRPDIADASPVPPDDFAVVHEWEWIRHQHMGHSLAQSPVFLGYRFLSHNVFLPNEITGFVKVARESETALQESVGVVDIVAVVPIAFLL